MADVGCGTRDYWSRVPHFESLLSLISSEVEDVGRGIATLLAALKPASLRAGACSPKCKQSRLLLDSRYPDSSPEFNDDAHYSKTSKRGTGISRSTIYLRIAQGTFPKPVSLGERAVGWLEAEVNSGYNDELKRPQ